ncbi:hypothetical protein BDW75DRAFT_247587 [Aspergillus navahoensis]
MSLGHTSEKGRKTRASRPKVRTGCATCKYSESNRSRHKKCDEGRPSCLACIRAGRSCEYRETVDHRTRAARWREQGAQTAREAPSDCHPAALVPIVRAAQANLSPDERRYLDIFRKITAAQCAGYFYDEFWQRLVHQVSEEEPAVCHAVISLGSLNYRFLQLRMGDPNGSRAVEVSFSLQQCNKAISCLRQRLAANRLGPQATEIALVTCIILVSTLLFQEDAQSAGRHLRSGLKLLEYLRDKDRQTTASLAIAQAFAGLHLGWLSFSTPEDTLDGGAQHPSFPLSIAASELAADINEASGSLVSLARLVLPSSPQGSSWGAGDPDALLGELRGWRRQIKESAVVRQLYLSHRDRNALTLLELWSEVLYIILNVETQPLPREAAYDAFFARFQRAVELAKILLAAASTLEPLPIFTVNIGIIAPLFFCGFKCRHWLVRKEALLLLRRWRRQEGIWSSNATARVLTRVIEIESEGLTPEEVIPEASRIESIHVDTSGPGSGLRLRYRRLGGAGPWKTEWL